MPPVLFPSWMLNLLPLYWRWWWWLTPRGLPLKVPIIITGLVVHGSCSSTATARSSLHRRWLIVIIVAIINWRWWLVMCRRCRAAATTRWCCFTRGRNLALLTGGFFFCWKANAREHTYFMIAVCCCCWSWLSGCLRDSFGRGFWAIAGVVAVITVTAVTLVVFKIISISVAVFMVVVGLSFRRARW